MYVPLKRM